jgi:MFS family permease
VNTSFPLDTAINIPKTKTPTFQITAASIVMAISVLGDSLFYSVLPSRLNDFGLIAGVGAGLLLSINRWIRLASNTWAASISKKFGLKKPFFFSLLLGTTTTMAYGLLRGFWPLLIARIGWGFCFSIQLVTIYMVILRQGSFHRGKYMGLYNALFRTGSLIAVLVGGFLTDLIGIQSVFLLFAALMVFNLPLIALLEEQHPTPSWNHEVFLNQDHTRTSQYNLKSKKVWSFLLGTSNMIHTNQIRLLGLNYLRFTNSFTVSGLIVATLGFLVQERFGDFTELVGFTFGAATLTGLILGTSWGSEVSLSIYFGHISDKISQTKVLRLCIPIITTGTLLIIFDNPLPMLLGIPVVFVANTATKVALDAAVGDIASLTDRANVMARYATWTDLGAALGPLVGYGIIQFTSPPWAFFGSALLVLSGLMVYTFTDKKSLYQKT